MNVDITNHLIPWTQVKQMIQEAKHDAWNEGAREAFESECYTVTDDWSIFKANPYQEDA